MARPKGIWTPEVTRRRIQTTKLMQRLQNHALGLADMTATQIKAAEILLRKKLPDLSATEITGEIKQRDITDQPLSADDWERQYSDSAH